MKSLKQIINWSLKEDSASQDITTRPIVPTGKSIKARLFAKQEGVICGLDVAKQLFHTLNKKCMFKPLMKDGQFVHKGKMIAQLSGPACAVLTGERTALNFIQHLSGVATLTYRFVQKTKGTKAKIFDTRKTIPGLRELQKYAVRCGGGQNHRMNLREMAMIKDNHLMLSGTIESAVRKIRKASQKAKVEVECDNISQVKEAVSAGADIIMLDNMPPKSLRRAISVIRQQKGSRKKRSQIEISGGVTLKNVRRLAKLGVDRISIGALTHSASALDISLELRGQNT